VDVNQLLESGVVIEDTHTSVFLSLVNPAKKVIISNYPHL